MGKKGKGVGDNRKRIGCLIIILGILIFLALIMPPGFWWFMLGASLICTGIYIMCHRK